MTDRIDLAIQELETPVEQPISEATPETTEVQAETEQPETTEEVKTSEDVPFPKKALNALSRRDKRIGKLTAENQAAQSELARLRQELDALRGPKVDPNRPREEDFQNYGDYLKAEVKYDLKTEMSKEAEKPQRQEPEVDSWAQERAAALDEQVEKAKASLPDIADVLGEYADVIASLSPEIKRVFLEADNGAVAAYNLAKSGKLLELDGMSPIQVAIEVGRSQEIVPTKRTQAPAPLTAAKGTGTGTPLLDNMSYQELKAWRQQH